MSYQVLARKWRPREFSQVVGQKHVVQALCNALDTDRLHHAYLFTGTRGVGKTTLARVLAKCFNCERGVSSRPCGECSACRELDEGRFINLLEVDAASRAKVDETRDLMDNVQFSPARGRFKVYLIDEVHMFSAHSFNALLKTLEEPPPHVKFLLATTDPQRLPVTVLSRCLQFNLKRVSVGDIVEQIERIVADEGLSAETAATRLLARAADGSLRDALSLLDQAIAYSSGRLETDTIQQMLGGLDQGRVFEMLEALASGDASMLMASVEQLAEHVVDFSTVLGELLSALQAIAKTQLVADYQHPEAEQAEVLKTLAERLSAEDVQLYYQIGLMGARDLPLAPDPRAGFEMILLRMLAFRPAEAEPLRRPIASGSAQKRPASPAAVDAGACEPKGSDQKGSEPKVSEQKGSESKRSEPMLEPHRWADIVTRLPVSGLTRELAANSVLAACAGVVVELRLNPGHAHLQTRKASAQLEAALQGYRGVDTKLSIVLDSHQADTPADQAQRAANDRKEAAIEAIENDPNVRSLLETFEAVIDKSSVEPRNDASRSEEERK